MITLKGITWNHSRGFTPLAACCQRYSERHPAVQVEWHKRSLQAFADYSVETLSGQYDLLIIDHPSVGEAFESNCLVDFNQYIEHAVLRKLESESTGFSYQSYSFKKAQLALPIDAATPVSSYRKDLLQQHAISVPQTWNEVISLAGKGKVAMPAIAIDILMNFYMFCIACGNEPFTSRDEIVDGATGLHALDLMNELYSRIDRGMFDHNPIAVAEIMTSTDDYWYCPFAYGYSNYARSNYVAKPLTYGDVVSYNGEEFQSTLGGTGIAVSAHSKYIQEALSIAAMLVSEKIQAGLYLEHGGQPAHKKAWQSDRANTITNSFFSQTLPALERAYMRPRYDGYLQFQDEGGMVLYDYLKLHTASPRKVIQQLNKLYRKSLPTHRKQITA